MTDHTGQDESVIVRRYRSLLRILPPSYRAAREEEMVAVFAEGVGDSEEERLGRPDPAEAISVVGLAVRAWLGGPGSAPRLFSLGQTVRLFGALGLLAQAVLAGADVLRLLTIVFFGSNETRHALRVIYGTNVALTVAWSLAVLLCVPAYVALVRGQHRTARVLALISVVPPLIRVVIEPWTPWVSFAVLIPVLLSAVAVAVAFHRDAPAVRPIGGLAALPVGAVAVFAALWPSSLALNLTPDGVCGWIALAAGAFCLVRGRAAADHDLAHRSSAIALFAALIFGVRMVTAIDYGGTEPYAAPVLYGQAAALLLVAGLLARVSVRTLRRAGAAPGERLGRPT
ncbi:hypothetical protein [Actinoallomurus sp. NPDC050550]|uniref:hypothetical protein n=1 Tax=Actinoallomurus sp. NPDC050550 TaxID=3154937 RepID=UPI0033E7BE9D